MEDQEPLKSSAVISQLPDSLKDQVHDLLANGVVAPGVVVGGVLLAIDELLRMKEAAISSDPGLVNDGWLQVDEDSARDVFASSSLAEEGGE